MKQRTATINADIESGLSGIKTAKAFANEEAELEKFDVSNDSFKTSKRAFHRAMGRFNAVMEFFLCILSVAVIDLLGLEPVSTALAIGAGTLIFNHVTNSGFWVVSKFFNLDLKQGLKYITIPDAVAGVIGFICVFILASVGLLH